MDFDDFILCSKETLLLVVFIDLFNIDVCRVFT